MKEPSYIRRLLLRELSEGSRTPISVLARRIGCSRSTILSNMRAMEGEYGLHYTIEFDRKRLGIMQNQMLCIKFGVKPGIGEVERIFVDDPSVRLVARTEGDFDLLVNMVSDSGEEYAQWGLKTALKLLEYQPTISQSLVTLTHVGFIPVPNPMLERLDLTAPRIDELDKRMLMLLNDNSRITYEEMTKTLGEKVQKIRYHFKKIMASGLIVKFTAVAEKPPTGYNMAMFVNYKLAPGIVEKHIAAKDYYMRLDGEMPLVNSFPYLARTSGSYMFFGLGCFESEEKAMKSMIRAHSEIYGEENVRMSHARIVDLIKGHLPVRNLDMKKEYNPDGLDSGPMKP